MSDRGKTTDGQRYPSAQQGTDRTQHTASGRAFYRLYKDSHSACQDPKHAFRQYRQGLIRFVLEEPNTDSDPVFPVR